MFFQACEIQLVEVCALKVTTFRLLFFVDSFIRERLDAEMSCSRHHETVLLQEAISGYNVGLQHSFIQQESSQRLRNNGIHLLWHKLVRDILDFHVYYFDLKFMSGNLTMWSKLFDFISSLE